MRIVTSAMATIVYSAALVFAQEAPKAPPPAPIPPASGIIQSFDGKVIKLTLNDGQTESLNLAPNAVIIFNAKRTLSDIKPGDFVASGGTRGPDGKIRANEIRIYSSARGEGQFPMAKPDQVMTNATVKEVMTGATVKQVGNSDGVPVIKLSFHGAGTPGATNCTGRAADAPGGAGTGCVGETEFEVPADTPVVAPMPGDASMLKPGAKATISVKEESDGSISVTRVTVSE